MSYQTDRVLRNLLYVACGFCLLLLMANCTTPSELEPKPDEEPVTELVVALGRYSLAREPVDHAIRAFEAKHPQVRVRVNVTEPLRYDQDLSPEQFEGIDLYIDSIITAQRLHGIGALMDLSAVPLPPPDPDLAQVVDNVALIGGERVFQPLQITAAQFLMAKSAMAGTTLEAPAKDWTYSDLADLLREIKAANKQVSVQAGMLMSTIARSYGGGFYDGESERWRLNTPENLAAFSLLRDLMAEELLQADGDTSFFIDGPDSPVLDINFSADTRRYHVLPWPAGPAGRVTGMSMTGGAVVMKSGRHPELAIAFLLELTSIESATAFAGAGIRPLVDAPAATALWRDQLGAETAAVVDLTLAGLAAWQPSPVAPFAYGAELRERITSGEPIEDVLFDIERRLNEAAGN